MRKLVYCNLAVPVLVYFAPEQAPFKVLACRAAGTPIGAGTGHRFEQGVALDVRVPMQPRKRSVYGGLGLGLGDVDTCVVRERRGNERKEAHTHTMRCS